MRSVLKATSQNMILASEISTYYHFNFMVFLVINDVFETTIFSIFHDNVDILMPLSFILSPTLPPPPPPPPLSHSGSIS